MAHSHTTPVEGCFGCKVAGLGFQGLRSRHGRGLGQRVEKISEDPR